MAIRQLSVFIENKKGSLHEITDVLANAGIDLRSMCVADTTNFGIVRIISTEPERALEVLTKEGHAANVREVVAMAVPDVPGGLAKALNLLETSGVNIEYLYALITKASGKAYTVMRTDNTAETEKILKDNGIELLDEEIGRAHV